MNSQIEELGERLYRMSPAGDMQRYILLAQELAGRIHESVKGKVTGRPSLGRDEYADQREAVLDRDNYQCRACATNRNLTVDHIVARSQGGPDHPDNLWTLCSRCHDLKEHGILKPVQDQATGRWRVVDTRFMA